ncbi:MAG: twitching motility protein PilT [Lachnospiraceae bacterium]|jgi:hypothetical protein|nr:twitching motility protein PilT [Lachnospiraceae bacterium]
MVQLILGKKGKGKTRHLLEKVNKEILTARGNIVYLDKNTKHMYELHSKVRLINVMEYYLGDSREFLGFVNGIISQDHDLEQMYLDSFLTIACVKDGELELLIKKLEEIGKRFDISFILSCAIDQAEISEALHPQVIVSL